MSRPKLTIRRKEPPEGVAALKIDQSFVQNMLDDPGDLAILKGTIGLASAFKCDVTASDPVTAS